jgi:hypothetical protein
LEGLAVRASIPSKLTIEVKCSLIDEYVKKPSAHAMSTFNGSSVKNSVVTRQRGMEYRGFKSVSMYMEVFGRILEYSNGIVMV